VRLKKSPRSEFEASTMEASMFGPRLTVTIQPKIDGAIKAAAAEDGVSLTEIVHQMLRDWSSRRERKQVA
jgi:hypothetical protein